jgi:AcrR family transcriptional regulator
MPKLVDVDARRKDLLEAVWRIIPRSGIAAATTRAIAREAGVSNGVLSHYFPDKDSLLIEALRSAYAAAQGRMRDVTRGLVGLEAVRAIMLEALPLDDKRLLEAQIGVSFWGLALGNERLLEVERAEWERFWDVLSFRVDEAVALEQLAPEVRADDLTHELIVLVEGISVQAVLYPQRVPPHRQLEILDSILERASARSRRPERTRKAAAKVPGRP